MAEPNVDEGRYCPGCGTRMVNWGAKLKCPGCPYYEGCCEGEAQAAREGD